LRKYKIENKTAIPKFLRKQEVSGKERNNMF